MKTPVRKRKGEAGQAILLVVVAMSIFLLGATGLAIDASQMYAQRQQAQAAADAAAIASIYSIFNNYNSGTNMAGVSPHDFAAVAGTTYTCASSDARTPCYYAQTLNGFNKASDTITYTPNPGGLSIPSLSSDPVNLLRVSVQRQVTTTLMKFLNSSNPNVTAIATAAIVSNVSPIPIIITHPSNPSTFKGNGNITIKICGGPKRSIQVNSSDATTQSVSGGSNVVDLSQAGPGDSGTCTCTTGCTGADFGDFGGPNPSPFSVSYGPQGKYVQPASPILDPLASVPVPTKPGAGISRTGIAAGGTASAPSGYVTGNTVTCPPSTSPGGCDFFFPGDYPSGISAHGPNNYTAYFFPGLYYMDSNGFHDGSNGNMAMYPGATNPDISATSTGSGMLVYNTGSGVFKIGSNAGASLVGSDPTSVYKGILLFQDRSATAHITKNTDDHIIGGGGALSLQGTIYIHNSYSVMTSSHYQLLQLQGSGGNNTLIQGEIIANQLLLGGSGTIKMNLNPNVSEPVRQITLVQ